MASNIFGTKRNIDMVFCIDGTGSMIPCIDSVKENARKLHLEFASAMTDLGSEIDSMRIKIIVFRDYKDGPDMAIQESPFYELPSDQAEFESFLSGISACGGDDAPENGLEALYYAMKSDFTTGAKDRQVIVLFTDADALALGERSSLSGYPLDMVDEDGLVSLWTNSGASQDSSIKLREKIKRMVIFAPSGTKYEELKGKLNRSIFSPVDDHAGLADISFDVIIKQLAASASGV